MTLTIHLRLFVWSALLWAVSAQAAVTPAFIFQDHMVLQAGKPVSVWGQAAPEEKVSVRFAGQTVSTTADGDGAWKVTLAPLERSAAPADLIFEGSNTVTFKDVLVGEVWLCAGQSNMEWKLNKVRDAEKEIAAADHPLIRQFLVGKSLSNTPEPKLRGKWAVCTPAQAGTFTGVGYFFARELSEKLGVPVGLINSSWGGTDLEAWMSAESIAKDPQLSFVAEQWQKRLDDFPARQANYDELVAKDARREAEAKTAGQPYTKPWRPKPPNPDGSPHHSKPSALYNAMIHPLRHAALAGVLWYQGENNSGRAAQYGQLFPAFITGWREAFGQPDLPFYWVQLPNFRGNPWTNDWAILRAGQAQGLALPSTGQAITIDVGEVANIHPLNKQDVGHRLALIALQKAYGQKIVSSGPVFFEANFSDGMARVTFTEIADGLAVNGPSLTGFELAGEDRVFRPGEARIEGDTVVIRSAEVPAPVAVRYAWRNAPEATLKNSEGLPAAPFRSDTW